LSGNCLIGARPRAGPGQHRTSYSKPSLKKGETGVPLRFCRARRTEAYSKRTQHIIRVIMAETGRRRRRPAVYVTWNPRNIYLLTTEPRSCTLCRRRKIRCNREMPCSNCIRSKNVACVYENEPAVQISSVGHDGASSSSPASTAAASEAECLRIRIKYLERQLKQTASSVPAPSPVSNVEAATTRMGGTFYIHHGNSALGQNPRVGISKCGSCCVLCGNDFLSEIAGTDTSS